MRNVYPCSGLLPVGADVQLEWDDQGRDLASRRQERLAVGNGRVVAVNSDAPFPNGFGPIYPVVAFDDGPFAGHEMYYGHCSSRVGTGQRVSLGQLVAVADQGHNWAGTSGWWTEFGEAWGGIPGPKRNAHWYDRLMEQNLVRIELPLAYGDDGHQVERMTNNLAACGYLAGAETTYGQAVHGAVIAFKTKHKIAMPPAPSTRRGWVDAPTLRLMHDRAVYCTQHKTKEYP